MPRGNVRDLVGEHAGELALALHEVEQPARDEDVSTGHREGIDLRRIHYAEVVGDVRAPRALRQVAAYGDQISVDDGVIEHRQVFGELRGRATAEGDFVVIAEHVVNRRTHRRLFRRTGR